MNASFYRRTREERRVVGPGGTESMSQQHQTGDVVKERTTTRKDTPKLYKVILLNDDYTTMEFVMSVLETVFQQSPAEAYKVMMNVHRNGRGIAGVYPWEVAETKVDTVASLAKGAGYPLKAVTEDD
jgi:ATP-dependent Clp protease adaptor protein ClpS